MAIIGTFAIGISGCSLFYKKEELVRLRSDPKFFQNEQEIESGFALLDSNKAGEANLFFKNFLAKNSDSRHYVEAQYGLAYSFEMLEDWYSAKDAYRMVLDRQLNYNYEHQALALYRLSFVYEALGEYEKALAALTDALRWKNYLPMEISKAEIPARIASFYMQVGETALADRYLIEAENGMAMIKAAQRPSPELNTQLAKSLWHMGFLSLNQLSEDTYSRTIRALSRSQIYLLKAIELKDPQWSPRALESIQVAYKYLFNFAVTLKEDSGLDWQASHLDVESRREAMLMQLTESAEILKSYEIIGDTETEKVYIDLNVFINDLIEKSKDTILGNLNKLPLTREAEQLQSLKRQPVMGGSQVQLLTEDTDGKGTQKTFPKKSQDPN